MKPLHSGILITNLGTPDAPTPSALRRYLAEFLWDERVVDLARIPWWLILHGIILRTRPGRVSKAYQKVWTDEGGPLLVISKQQRDAIEKQLSAQLGKDIPVALGMRYGNPSIASAMEQLRDQGVERIIVLPLFPQYSAATTGSTFDAVSQALQSWRSIPEMVFINQYHDHPAYINALANTVRETWNKRPPAQRLLLSFHGLPLRYHTLGDPYRTQCEATTAAVAEQLELHNGEIQLVYQSRFGREEWLQPYTDETLQQLPADGIHNIDIVCPGFSADCVETLEEIAIQNHELFLEAGGSEYHYIPALNSRDDHIQALTEILLERW